MAHEREGERDSHDMLLEHWRVIRRQGYVVLATFAAGILLAAAATHMMTPIYRATALVLVEDDMTRLVGLQATFPFEILQERYYKTQAELIESRAVLRAAAKRLGLARTEEFAGTSDVAAALAARVSVDVGPNTKLLRVSYEGPDQGTVAGIANMIVKCYKEETIRRRESSSRYAAVWLDEQLPKLERQVSEAEKRLQAFQEEHKVVSLDRAHDVISQRLEQLNTDVTSAERERIGLEADYAQVGAAAGDPAELDSLPAVTDNPMIRSLESQILALGGQRTDLLRTLRPDHRDVRSVDSKIADLEAERREKVGIAVSSLRKRLGAARAKEKALREVLAVQQQRALELNEKLIRLNGLKRDVEHAKQRLAPVRERSGQVDLVAALKSVPVQIIDEAERPLGPAKPRRSVYLAIGAFLGLIAGVNLAFLIERASNRIRSPEDVERAAHLRILGVVPHMTARESRKLFLACHFDPKSTAAEAYRSIRTHLLLATGASGSSILMVTSPVDKEGKTTTASNIASAMAQAQKRVLLVDGDMRRSSAHKAFDMDRTRGLSTCLMDGLAPAEAAQQSEIPGLSVMTAGKTPENPAELLGSAKMVELLGWAKRSYDLVIVDAPPVGVVTDPSIIAPLVDGVVLVVRADRTPRRAAAHGRELLEDAKAKVIGAVLNDIPSGRPGTDTDTATVTSTTRPLPRRRRRRLPGPPAAAAAPGRAIPDHRAPDATTSPSPE